MCLLPFGWAGFILPDAKNDGAISAHAAPGAADILERGAQAGKQGGHGHGRLVNGSCGCLK
jgi:hypothetical protein